MTEAGAESSEPLALKVRDHALQGAGIHTTVAFLVLLCTTTVMAGAILILAMDWSVAVSRLSYEFYFEVSTNIDSVPEWLAEAAQRIDSMRESYAFGLSNFLSLMVIVLLLFLADLSRFAKPKGTSLLRGSTAAESVKSLLNDFGYFRDLRLINQSDFMAFGRIFYAPKIHMTRILSGERAVHSEARLRFFLGHEYAHAVTKDNVVNSLYRVVLFGCAVVVSVYFSFFIVVSGMIISGFVENVALFAFLVFTIVSLFVLSVAFSFYGVLLSFIKSREFFADQSAYQLYREGKDPYNSGPPSRRPGPFSAWSRDCSAFERSCHFNGQSLHARNILPGLLVLHASMRTLFMMVAPEEVVGAVFVFDVVLLLLLTLFVIKSPPHSEVLARPVLPWLVSTVALMGMTLSSAGLRGYYRQQANFAEQPNAWFETALALPIAVMTLFSFLALLQGAWKSLACKREVDWPAATDVLKRLFFYLLSLPGMFLGFCALFGCIMFCYALLVGTFNLLLNWEVFTFVAFKIAVGASLLAIVTAFLYLNLIALRFWSFVLEVIFTSVIFGGLVGLLLTVLLHFTDPLISVPADSVDQKVQEIFMNLREDFLAMGMSTGIVLALMYLVLRIVSYWSRTRLRKLDRKVRL